MIDEITPGVTHHWSDWTKQYLKLVIFCLLIFKSISLLVIEIHNPPLYYKLQRLFFLKWNQQ